MKLYSKLTGAELTVIASLPGGLVLTMSKCTSASAFYVRNGTLRGAFTIKKRKPVAEIGLPIEDVTKYFTKQFIIKSFDTDRDGVVKKVITECGESFTSQDLCQYMSTKTKHKMMIDDYANTLLFEARLKELK